MTRQDFFNFDVLQDHVTKSGLIRARFKNGRVLIVSTEYKIVISVMAGHGIGYDPVTIKFEKGQAKDLSPDFNLSNVHLPIKYPSDILLKADKI